MSSIRLAIQKSLEESGLVPPPDKKRANQTDGRKKRKKRKYHHHRKRKDANSADHRMKATVDSNGNPIIRSEDGISSPSPHRMKRKKKKHAVHRLKKIKKSHQMGEDGSMIPSPSSVSSSPHSQPIEQRSDDDDSSSSQSLQSSSHTSFESSSEFSTSSNDNNSNKNNADDSSSDDESEPDQNMDGIFDSERSSGESSNEDKRQSKIPLRPYVPPPIVEGTNVNIPGEIMPKPQPPKRKRGRPRLKPRNDDEPLQQQQQQQQQQPLPKGSRGEGDVEEESYPKIVGAKRKKNISGYNSATSVKRPGPGRPRKIQSEDGSRTKKVKKKHNRKQYNVKEPSFEVLQWIGNMTRHKQRKKIATGMRVKVRFLNKNKQKWYGGVVVDVAHGGKRIRIQYDDGTSEETSFPDKEIIVDDEENGHHQVSADAFIPRPLHESERIILQKEVGEEDKLATIECQNLEAVITMKKESKTSISRNNSMEEFDQHQPIPKSASNPKVTEDTRQSIMTTESIPTQPKITKDDVKPSSTTRLEIKLTRKLSDISLHKKGGGGHSLHGDEKVERKTQQISPSKLRITIDTTNKNGDKIDSSTITQQPQVEEKSEKRSNEGNLPSLTIRLKPGKNKNKKILSVQKSDGKKNSSGLLSSTKRKLDDDNKDETGTSSYNQTTPTNCSTALGSKVESNEKYSRTAEPLTPTGESAWMGDDEGQGMKRSHQSEVEDASESEVDISYHAPKQTEKPTKNKNNDVVNTVSNPQDSVKPNIESLKVDNQLKTGARSGIYEKRYEEIPAKSKVSNVESKPSGVSEGMEISEMVSPKQKRARLRSPIPPGEQVSMKDPHAIPNLKDGNAISHASRDQIVSPPPKEESQDKMPIQRENQHVQKQINSLEPKVQRGHEQKVQRANHLRPETPNGGTSDEEMSKQSRISMVRRAAKQRANQNIASKKEHVIGEKHPKPKKRGRKPAKRDKDEAENWVKCDRCNKWRYLPTFVDVDALPEQWYCELNIYDPKRNNCNAPEQTADEVAREKKKAKKAATAAAVPVAVADVKRPKSQSPMTVPKVRTSTPHKLPFDSPKGDKGGQMSALETSIHSQISSSEKKIVTSRANNEMKPNPPVASNRASSSNIESSTAPARPKVPGRRGRRPKENKGEQEQESWVECNNCKKWRKLPKYICVKDLPDIWFCRMNTWDPRSASCAVQEEDYNKESTILGNDENKSANNKKLSYRSLIPHSRKANRHMRPGESLFCSSDGDGEPLYKTSSVYQSKTEDNEKEGVGMPFLELMNHTQLWKDLYRGGALLRDFKTSTQQPQSLRSIVLDALDTNTLTLDDVILECQSKWNNSASFTSVKIGAVLNDLEADGIVKKIQPSGKFQMIRYCKGENDENSVESFKHKKISKFKKHWKQQV